MKHLACSRSFTLLSAVIVCSGLMACSSPPANQGSATATPAATEKPAAPSTPAGDKRYDLKGKVVAVDKAGKMVTVDAEEIPGFMGAMAMPYAVKDPTLLEPLAAGDRVTAQVVAGASGGYWLEHIVVTEKGAPAK